MCRHLAYLGPPRSLHELMYAPPYSLERQSYAARMGRGVVNADGFGVGWHAEGTTRRYRRAQPIWTDVSFAEVAGAVETGCVLAAIRSATAGFPVDESSAQPFRADGRLFSHNGRIAGFAAVEGKLRRLAAEILGDDGYADIPDARAPVDSALVFAIAAGHWRAGHSLAGGLAAATGAIGGLIGQDSRLNLLASDGSSLAATAWGDTLYARSGTGPAPHVVIASEPYDDEPGWVKIPDRTLVTADSAGLATTPLKGLA